MPKNLVTAKVATTAVRSSPRKRKRTDEQSEELNSIQHEPKDPDASTLEDDEVKPAKRGRTKAGTPPLKGNSIASRDHLVQNLPGKSKQKKELLHTVTTDSTEANDVEKGIVKTVSITQKAMIEQNRDNKSNKPIRKRKTKEEKEAEAMPLALRTNGLKMFVGAHVSIAKGVENAVTNALRIGGNAFALFLKSQRKWENPSLKDENRDAFKQACTHHHYDQSSHIVPHGSYLVNLASADKDMSKRSYDAFVDDLRRCEALGIKYYNFHPGSTNKEPLNEAIGRLAENLNRALAATNIVTPLLENMAGHGSIIGSRFSDLRDIIAAIKPEYRSRIGICIDTCHAFAAGYDLRSPEAFKQTFQELDETVGLKYLKAMHINDSKAPFNSHRDLHQNIGVGFLGLRAFHNVMNDARLQNVPLILETPCDRPDPQDSKKTIDDKNVWAREIKLLESLIGMDPESKEFIQLESDLSEQGRVEREKMEKSIATRDEKAKKKTEKALEKGQKSIATMFGGKSKKRKGSVSSSSSLSDAESDA